MLGVHHRCWPVEALLECVPNQGPRRGVMLADPTMDILQQLFPCSIGMQRCRILV
jgi:hypothetical protein